MLFDLERIGPAEVRVLGGLNDSKQQLPEARAEVFPVILRVAARVAIVSRCAPGIDARGLHITNLRALHDALAKVACPGCICLSDGFPVAALAHDQLAVIGGDAKSAAIAAASVIAKETRDRYMRRADVTHPGWEFASHVGYSTPSTGRRSSGSGSRHCTAARSSPRPTSSWRWGRRSERRLEVLEAHQPPAAIERHPDRVESQERAYGRSGRSLSQLAAILRTCPRLRAWTDSNGAGHRSRAGS